MGKGLSSPTTFWSSSYTASSRENNRSQGIWDISQWELKLMCISKIKAIRWKKKRISLTRNFARRWVLWEYRRFFTLLWGHLPPISSTTAARVGFSPVGEFVQFRPYSIIESQNSWGFDLFGLLLRQRWIFSDWMRWWEAAEDLRM